MDDTKRLTLIKRGHTHLFHYQPGDEQTMLGVLIAKAEDPECALDWLDVIVLSHQMGVEAKAMMNQQAKNHWGPK